MYTCETCLKEFTSQKRYLSHIERCEETKDQLRMSSRSVGISDVEDERSRSRSRSRIYSDSGLVGTPKSSDNTVDKLLKDKLKYKNEIKKYKQEIRDRIEEHRLELERVQEYFQEQIVSLTEERDDLSEQIFSEKERLRTNFVNKLSMEKKRLENLYGSKNSVALRLQSNLDKLQTQLQQKIEENEMIVDNQETQLSELNSKHDLDMETLKEELHNTRKMFDREREDLRRGKQLFQNEKDQSLAVLRREKDNEIQDIAIEKDTVIQSLKHQISNLKRDNELQQRESERALVELRNENELSIQERNRVIDRLKETHIRSLDQLKVQNEGKLHNLNEQMNKKLQESKDLMETTLRKKENEHNLVVQSYITSSKTVEQESNKKIDEMKKQIADLQDQNIKNTEYQNRKNKDAILDTISKYEIELNNLEKRLANENKESNQDRDDTINELERLNHTLGAQVGHYRSAMDHMKVDTDRLKEQFISNLNKQKQNDDKVIQEREKVIKDCENRINILENQLKSAQTNNSSKLESANNTIKMLEDKNKNLTERISAEESNRNQLSLNYDKQLKESRDILAKKISIEIEKVKNESDHQLKESNDKIKQLETKLQQASLYRANISGLQEKQIQAIKNDHHQSLEQIKKESVSKLNSYDKKIQDMENKIKQKDKKIGEYEIQIKQIKKESLSKLDLSDQKIREMEKKVSVSSKTENDKLDLEGKLKMAENKIKDVQRISENLLNKQRLEYQTQIESERENRRKEREELIKKSKDKSTEEQLKKTQEKLNLANSENDKLKQENNAIRENKKTMQSSALNEINSQQKQHDIIINQKNNRIKELESLLSDAIRKITV